MKKLIEKAQIATATALAFGPTVALAQADRVSGGSATSGSRALSTSGILNLLEQASTFLIAIAGIIAVIMIVWGGIVWMTKGSEKGKTFITNGVIGVAIVMGVGIILATLARVIGTQSL